MSARLVPTGSGALVPYTDAGPPIPGDYAHLAQVVELGYAIRDARSFLQRHLSNPLTYRLVEGRRGEQLGSVREIIVEPADGGETVHVRALRTLPDGSIASPYAPAALVTVRIEVAVASGGALPSVQPRDRIVLVVPVRSYLRFLPGIYQGTGPMTRQDVTHEVVRGQRGTTTTTVTHASHDADQFRRFLLLFQHLMTTVTDRIDAIPQLTDPALADPRFLPWIASWVGFELDESLPLHQQRELVRRSIRLYRTRGTKAGIEEIVQVLTSASVDVAERVRPRGAVLGTMTLAGGKDVEERYLRNEPRPFYLVSPEHKSTSYFTLVLEPRERFRKRFGERATQVLRRIAQIVTNEKPAHVTFTITFEEGKLG